ncbi:MAG: hypothetical protein KDD47_03380 [Acidobacteria bacterium]|nr:hypothetical protein [Acidobacteriota bacterium]
MDIKDLALARAVLDVHRLSDGKERVRVPLYSLHQVHVLDRENALEATRQRVEALRKVREELLEKGAMTFEVLAEVLPSVSWIKVVAREPGSYIAFEGNGRLVAMKEVFSEEDGMEVEVEEYRFRNPAKVVRRLDRVRKLNGLK